MKTKFLFPTLIVLVSLVLSVRQLGEPDVWWQIRTGEFILENGYVPDTDVFSYTYAGDPWFNVKWGTEVIMALVVRWFGPESLLLLNWLVLLGIIWFIRASYIQLKIITNNQDLPQGMGMYTGLLFFLMAMAYRINGRPEMMSHLLTAVYIFLFLRHFNKSDRLIFLLIPLQLIWANLHEAYGVGMVLIVIFLASTWFRNIFFKKTAKVKRREALQITALGLLALLAVVIHPMGTSMLIQPFDIFGQLGENKFTTELWSFKHAEYWNLAAYLSLFMVLVMLYRWSGKLAGIRRWQSLPLYYLLILAAFFYLAASANRNLPFVLIAFAPLVCLDFELWFGRTKWISPVYLSLAALFYLFVASGKFYQRFYPVEKYGLRVDIQSTPVGAAEFIMESGLSGNAYVDYFSSSYLLWALQPDFKSYLDLRDLDVFEAQFITNNLLNYTQPTTPTRSGKPLFRFMEELDDFSYVVMENNEKFINFHRYMNSQPDYVLGYADPLTSIYIKDKKENHALVETTRKMSLEDRFHNYGELKPGAVSRILTKVLAPWYQPMPVDYRNEDYFRVYKQGYLEPFPK